MSEVPEQTTVLVAGGGPGGSYAAAALAREGIDVVVLEADKFPRYHIGESMLPSMRYYLKFIDAYEKWNSHGFKVKNGAAFKLNWSRPEAYTDFIAAGGPQGHAWNVVRSEGDELLFKHAGESGAKIFDATKVSGIEFESSPESEGSALQNPGRPVSASWSRKDGTSGTIRFKYLIDASGRQGLLSTKYLKNRHYNQGLKNIANWGYWKNAGAYGAGTKRQGSPYFEALKDSAGWVWFIPLHNDTWSVGIVQNQDLATAKKRELGSPSSKEFYLHSLDLVPGIKELIGDGELISDIKSASDWSYSASHYAFPYARIVGDAGAFIDPFFSTGVHLALHGGLSAATTIAAAIKGDTSEEAAAQWHTQKTATSYTRFLVVVSSALKQIRLGDEPVISDFDEKSFDRAFDLFRPIIQGTVDANDKKGLTQEEISRTVEFAFRSFLNIDPELKESLVQKLKSANINPEDNDEHTTRLIDEIQKSLTAEESDALNVLRGRKMLRHEDIINVENFTKDNIDGLVAVLEHGNLGLRKGDAPQFRKSDLFSLGFLEKHTPDVDKFLTEKKGAQPVVGTESKTTTPNGDTNGSDLGDHHQSNGDHIKGHDPNGNAQGSSHGERYTNGVGHVNGSISKTLNGTAHDDNGIISKLVQPVLGDSLSLDESSRHYLISTFLEAAEKLETPHDTMRRLADTGRQLSLIKVGNNIGVFKALIESDIPRTAEELSKAHGADSQLVDRLLRYYAGHRFVKEVGKGRYAATQHTSTLADHGIASTLEFFRVVSNPAFHVLPEYLKELNHQSPKNGITAFHKSVDTDLNFFVWAKGNPKILKLLQGVISVHKEGDWLSAIPFADAIATLPKDQTIFVDINGNIGLQSRKLLSAFPELSGRIVLQDRAETIKATPPIEGVEKIAQDPFTPQTVKGAKYYYLNAVLQTLDDGPAVALLKAIVPALGPDSEILLDEVVLAEAGANLYPVGLDIQMLAMFGSKVRSLKQWVDLLDRAGLKIANVNTYTPVMRFSVISAVPK